MILQILKVCIFFPAEGVLAKSIEISKDTMSKYELLRFIFDKFLLLGGNNNVKVMTYLNDQPNNKIINYKGGWGILKGYGVDIDLIKDKNEVKKESGNKLSFLLDGDVFISEKSLLNDLIMNCDILYCSTDLYDNHNEKTNDYNDWINNRLGNGEFVCFFLSEDGFPTFELVIMGREKNILDKIDISCLR
ncbi:hypothetical protein [Actinobacillus suis]|uniref:Uncharacterized protein n=1 Tax=Actinobacillus suis H91-0380 TaxID=696748 RepID=K0FY90_ACTSU|nr:hypothetical protein [Actinobacillus suis]AFU19462.1 hypothetical protein ASU2_06620 [Actinobacillus suis H91-0380]AIJ31601.1 hypothetical protein ASU1_06690 [Actinobacillus suis ATCC 33415]OQS55888.1 hypothetical protein ASU3_11395 [Actinobacillus suis]OQS56128.1 hypothetical protein ASU4_11680 [Actinobacillus suis]SNV34675.1 Uncharacterised protein [Actinobacillus suis]